MSNDPRLDRMRQLAAEERTPVHIPSREDAQLADLRAVIHILACAMSQGRAVT